MIDQIAMAALWGGRSTARSMTGVQNRAADARGEVRMARLERCRTPGGDCHAGDQEPATHMSQPLQRAFVMLCDKTHILLPAISFGCFASSFLHAEGLSYPAVKTLALYASNS